MKVYVCYYAMTDYEYKEYLQYYVYNNFVGELDEIVTLPVDRFGVYGFTNKKKCFEKFRAFHNKKYFYSVMLDMDKESYEEMKHVNRQFYIDYRSFEKPNDFYKIPMTKFEFEAVDIESGENIYSLVSDIPMFDPDLFSEKGQSILDSIGYVSTYTVFYGTDAEREFYDYNFSFATSTSDILTVLNESEEYIRFVLIFQKLLNIEEFMKFIIEERRKMK